MNKNLQKVFIASDHAGFKLKSYLFTKLQVLSIDIIDLGCNSDDSSVDYPDFAQKIAQNIQDYPDSRGLLVCGSGTGMAIAANRYPFIRASVIHNKQEAILARSHNNINIACFGGRFIEEELALDCAITFLNTQFESGRHQPRVDKLGNMPYKGDIDKAK